MGTFKNAIRTIVPHRLLELRRAWLSGSKRDDSDWISNRNKFHEERHRRILRTQDLAREISQINSDDYDQLIEFLTGRGLPESQVREGSVPASSLLFLRSQLVAKLDGSKPVTALHIGNFVGVSLAFVTGVLKACHPNSLVVSVDPNLPHRGITNPQEHVGALLTACGLHYNVMILAGYSGRKSISNDGVFFGDYDPEKQFTAEAACEDTLRNLRAFGSRLFDLAMLDGNHEAAYLSSEIRSLIPLLKPNALVVLDDVDQAWTEIRDVFDRVHDFGLTSLARDGRIAIARLTS